MVFYLILDMYFFWGLSLRLKRSALNKIIRRLFKSLLQSCVLQNNSGQRYIVLFYFNTTIFGIHYSSAVSQMFVARQRKKEIHGSSESPKTDKMGSMESEMCHEDYLYIRLLRNGLLAIFNIPLYTPQGMLSLLTISLL